MRNGVVPVALRHGAHLPFEQSVHLALASLELDHVVVNVHVWRRRHAMKVVSICRAGSPVRSLDHDPVAAGRLERALKRRPAVEVLLGMAPETSDH